MNDIVSRDDECEFEHDHEEAKPNQLTPEKNNSNDNGKPNNEKPVYCNDQNDTHERKEKNDGRKEYKSSTEDFVIGKVFHQKIHLSRIHLYAKAVGPLYGSLRYAVQTDDDTWERTKHLQRSTIFFYCRLKKLPIPGTIDQADDG